MIVDVVLFVVCRILFAVVLLCSLGGAIFLAILGQTRIALELATFGLVVAFLVRPEWSEPGG